ncbi:MAG: hypothetical protein HeimC3_15510 [Candidatus Heimdallarchaeota archaeon LC_3]|nr:MAG: hypothetical protein HeimC3_15510 [Candidatus Heimdallarchaeota archaeon LC_3]
MVDYATSINLSSKINSKIMIKLHLKKFNFKKSINLEVLHPNKNNKLDILRKISKIHCLKLRNILIRFLSHSVILNYKTNNRICYISHPRNP